MKKIISNIISVLLLSAYLGFLILPVFHHHPISLGNSSEISSPQNSAQHYDPFQNSISECSFVQIAVTTYIHEMEASPNFGLLENSFVYQNPCTTCKSLQLLLDSKGLRAPPALS